MANEKLSLEENEDFFGVFYPLIMDDEITDIDYNGTSVWLTDSNSERRKWEGDVTGDFVETFTKRIANCVSKPFHKQQPILEAETKRLRITIVHESVARRGRCICIRKSLPYVRFDEDKMLREGYATPQILELLKNCVRARMNVVFCGEPGVGKTECAKFFSGYIPASERVITIEDNPEWHYGRMHPERDCVELQVSQRMDYPAAIKTCLRLNPKWIMLSETRSKEVVYLVEGFSTGVRGMTTLHADDVRNIPDRMLNMIDGKRDARRFENDIYTFIDVGILLRRREAVCSDGSRVIRRYIDQVCFFVREDGQNKIHLIVDEGRQVSEQLPAAALHRLRHAGITDMEISDVQTANAVNTDTQTAGIQAGVCGTAEIISRQFIDHAPIRMPSGDGFFADKKGGTYYGAKTVI